MTTEVTVLPPTPAESAATVNIVMRQLDALANNMNMITADNQRQSEKLSEVREIVASTSATIIGVQGKVSDVKSDLERMRDTNHTRFNLIHDANNEHDHELELLRERVSTVEGKVSFIFKCCMTIISAIVIVIGWTISIFGGDWIAKFFGK